MNTLKVRKLDPNAILPTQAHSNDAGYDIYALDNGEIMLATTEFNYEVKEGSARLPYIQYRTGLSVEPPKGYHVELFPRSSVSKTDLILANSIGLIDEGYRGELLFRFKIAPFRNKPLDFSELLFSRIEEYVRENCTLYSAGDRIGQLVLRKTERFVIQEVDELMDSERGAGGFGSSGN